MQRQLYYLAIDELPDELHEEIASIDAVLNQLLHHRLYFDGGQSLQRIAEDVGRLVETLLHIGD
jgi:hypothetical protein